MIKIEGLVEVSEKMKRLMGGVGVKVFEILASTVDLEVRRSIRRQFKQQNWAPLSAGYLAEKIASGYGKKSILVRTGEMRKAALRPGRYIREGKDLNIGMPYIHYAEKHQFGHGVPARPFFIADKKSERRVINMVKRHLNKLINR